MGTIFPIHTAVADRTITKDVETDENADVVGPVQPSRDAVIAAIGRCPGLAPLRTVCGSVGPQRQVRRERIVAALLERASTLPKGAKEALTAHLCSCSYAEIYDVQARHVSDDVARRHHLSLLPAWVDLEGEERYFAQRCAVALVEALCDQPRLRLLSA